MPELPEVETTKRGLKLLIINQVVNQAVLYRDNLRWEIPKHLPTTLANQAVNAVERRGKYLLIKFNAGTLIIHLGMSGSIRIVNNTVPLKKHDHFELVFTNGKCSAVFCEIFHISIVHQTILPAVQHPDRLIKSGYYP
jgi:formamidopyrimidine-DNA glycosylase